MLNISSQANVYSSDTMEILHWEETTQAKATALRRLEHVEADKLSMAVSYIQL